MLLLGFLFFVSFAWQLCAAPVQDVVAGGVPVQEKAVQDSAQLLTDEWVLREHLRKDGDTYTPLLPLDSLTLVLFDDHTYKLIRPEHTSVEWGKWQLSASRDLISVQVTNVDGYSILSAMLGRWQVEKLTPRQLVLRPYGAGTQYLVFERAL